MMIDAELACKLTCPYCYGDWPVTRNHPEPLVIVNTSNEDKKWWHTLTGSSLQCHAYRIRKRIWVEEQHDDLGVRPLTKEEETFVDSIIAGPDNLVTEENHTIMASATPPTTLEIIRELPAGIKSKVIQAAHKIAYKKHCHVNGPGAQYGAEKILYYDQDTWELALNAVDF